MGLVAALIDARLPRRVDNINPDRDRKDLLGDVGVKVLGTYDSIRVAQRNVSLLQALGLQLSD